MPSSNFPGAGGARLNGTLSAYTGPVYQDVANNRTLIRAQMWIDKHNINASAWSTDPISAAQFHVYRRNNANTAWESIYSGSVSFGFDLRPGGQQVIKWLWAFDIWVVHRPDGQQQATMDGYVQANVLGSTSVHHTITLSALGTIPPAPTAPQIIGVGSTSFVYSATEGTASPAAIEREVQVALDSAFTSGVTSFSPTTLASVSITGRTALTEYFLRSRVRNGRGWGPWSPVISYTTETVPGVPYIKEVTPTETTMDFELLPPDYTGGSIISYETELRSSLDDSLIDTFGGLLTGDFSGLEQGTDYYIRSRALNSAGWGPWTAPYYFRTLGVLWSTWLNLDIGFGTEWTRVGLWVFDGTDWKMVRPYMFDGSTWQRMVARP